MVRRRDTSRRDGACFHAYIEGGPRLHKGQANDFRSVISTIEEIQANLKPRYPVIGARELQVAERVKAGLSAMRIAAELALLRRPSTIIAIASSSAWCGKPSEVAT